MAREVATGQSAVLHQYEQQVERQKVEQAAQADRANTMFFLDAERQVFPLKEWFRMQRLRLKSMHSYSLVQCQHCTLCKEGQQNFSKQLSYVARRSRSRLAPTKR